MTDPGSEIDRTNRRDNEHAFRVGREILRAASQPPAPIDLNLIRDGAVSTMHWVWRQSIPPERVQAGLDREAASPEVAAAVGAIDDPLESLAAALTRASQECWRLGLAPVGITVHTQHVHSPLSYARICPDRTAEVTIAVSAVSREWIATNLRELAGERADRGRDTS